MTDSSIPVQGTGKDLNTRIVETDAGRVHNEIVELYSGPSLCNDAWGRFKTITDKTLFHALFTYGVPVATWKEGLNGVEQAAFSQATSEDGKLAIVSNGVLDDEICLSSFRFPRYEPNRGHLYSATEWVDNPTADAQASWGIFTPESGVGFRLRSGQLYGFLRTTIGGTTTDTEYEIALPSGVDLSKGNLFDIQFQWRGIGDYFFYINQELVASTEDLGNRTELSVFNPALPVAYEVINQGDDITLYSGCVDVTSEGGADNGKTYGSVSIDNQSGQVAISGFNVPIVVVRSKDTVNSLVNTRDTLALLATGYADQRALLRVWSTRDDTAITLNDQTWTDFGDGHLEYLEYDNPNVTNPMTFDTTKASLIFGARVDQDKSYATSALFEGRTEIYQTPGDIFIFTIHRETGGSCNVGVTYEFAEQI